MRSFAIAAVLAVVLSGCVTTGTKADPDVVASFQPGVTTLVDAERQLGPPNSASSMPDGSTVIVYLYTHAKASGASYIPIAGAFAGHTDSQSQMTELFFDAQGKYQRKVATTTQSTGAMH